MYIWISPDATSCRIVGSRAAMLQIIVEAFGTNGDDDIHPNADLRLGWTEPPRALQHDILKDSAVRLQTFYMGTLHEWTSVVLEELGRYITGANVLSPSLHQQRMAMDSLSQLGRLSLLTFRELFKCLSECVTYSDLLSAESALLTQMRQDVANSEGAISKKLAGVLLNDERRTEIMGRLNATIWRMSSMDSNRFPGVGPAHHPDTQQFVHMLQTLSRTYASIIPEDRLLFYFISEGRSRHFRMSRRGTLCDVGSLMPSSQDLVTPSIVFLATEGRLEAMERGKPASGKQVD